jgi:hypothetical protein
MDDPAYENRYLNKDAGNKELVGRGGNVWGRPWLFRVVEPTMTDRVKGRPVTFHKVTEVELTYSSDHSQPCARWGWVVNATLRPLYSREGASVLVAEKAGWVPGPI